tara:strand:- start:3092 stop:3220 length:129 start_codon:yes stop_codon:yes gene_type:complete
MNKELMIFFIVIGILMMIPFCYQVYVDVKRYLAAKKAAAKNS